MTKFLIFFFKNIIINIFIIFSYSDYPRSYLLENNVSDEERTQKRLFSPNLFREEAYSSIELLKIFKKKKIF